MMEQHTDAPETAVSTMPSLYLPAMAVKTRAPQVLMWALDRARRGND
jgi:hypothetical protein